MPTGVRMTGGTLFADDRWRESRSERAVSTTVGVALLVAIAVILATVVGVFVLGIAPSTSDPPDASFELTQQRGVVAPMQDQWQQDGTSTPNRFADCPSDPSGEQDAGLRESLIPTRVTAEHRGGEAVALENVNLHVSTTNGTAGATADDVADARGVGFVTLTTVRGSNGPPCSELPRTSVLSPGWNRPADGTITASERSRVDHWLQPDVDLTGGTGSSGTNGLPTAANEHIQGRVRCQVMYNPARAANGDIVLLSTVPAPADHYLLPGAKTLTSPPQSPESYPCEGGGATGYLNVSDDRNGALTTDDVVRIVWRPRGSTNREVLAATTVE
jgi:hypothetical protein